MTWEGRKDCVCVGSSDEVVSVANNVLCYSGMYGSRSSSNEQREQYYLEHMPIILFD